MSSLFEDVSRLLCTYKQNGQTPLHLAAMTNDVLAVQFLVNQGAKTNVRNKVCLGFFLDLDQLRVIFFLEKFGETPVAIAVSFGHWEIVQILQPNLVRPLAEESKV